MALILGGAEGIGLCIAHELLTEKLQKVALVGNDNCKGREAINILNCTYGKNKAIFVNCNIQSSLQVRECYSKIMKEFGRLDVVVNSAGIFDGGNWECEVLTNLMGTIHSVLNAYQVMNKGDNGPGGVILNMAGLYGLKPLFAAPTLAACQHGILGFSRSFGDRTNFEKSGVRMVTLCPGITNTNFIKDVQKRVLVPQLCSQMELFLSKVKRQNADVCGKSALHVIKYGQPGSVWVVAGSKLYSLKIPSWKKYRTLESQLM